MRKSKRNLVFIMLIIAGCTVCEGCTEDTTVNLPESAPVAVEDARSCPEYELVEIQCTITRLDADRLVDLKPYAVSQRIYKYAAAAVRQCYRYETVSWIYTEAMRQVNEGKEPETVEKWQRNALREWAGYDPVEV